MIVLKDLLADLSREREEIGSNGFSEDDWVEPRRSTEDDEVLEDLIVAYCAIRGGRGIVFESATVRERMKESRKDEFRSWGCESACKVDSEDSRSMQVLSNHGPELDGEEQRRYLTARKLSGEKVKVSRIL